MCCWCLNLFGFFFFFNGEVWENSDIRSCWQVLSELASPVSVLCADVEGLLEAVGHCFLCRVNQPDLTGGEMGHRHTPACECELRGSGCVLDVSSATSRTSRYHSRGENTSYSLRVHRRMRNDGQRMSEISQEGFPRTCPRALRAASTAKRLLLTREKRLWVGVWSNAAVSEPKICSHNQLLVTDGLILELEVKTKRLVVLSHICLVLLSSLGWW